MGCFCVYGFPYWRLAPGRYRGWGGVRYNIYPLPLHYTAIYCSAVKKECDPSKCSKYIWVWANQVVLLSHTLCTLISNCSHNIYLVNSWNLQTRINTAFWIVAIVSRRFSSLLWEVVTRSDTIPAHFLRFVGFLGLRFFCGRPSVGFLYTIRPAFRDPFSIFRPSSAESPFLLPMLISTENIYQV